MDFLCSNLVKTIFTYWIGTVFNLILQLANFFSLKQSRLITAFLQRTVII